jgi:hypothetical protein
VSKPLVGADVAHSANYNDVLRRRITSPRLLLPDEQRMASHIRITVGETLRNRRVQWQTLFQIVTVWSHTVGAFACAASHE